MVADFFVKNVTKSAQRDLTKTIATPSQIADLGQMVIDDNPFECVAYTDNKGTVVPHVQIVRQYYVKKVNYFDPDGKKIGSLAVRYPTVEAHTNHGSTLWNKTALLTAFGADYGEIDPSNEAYYLRVKCHDPTGDDYYVAFSRKTVLLSSYQDDAILERVEKWADAVPAIR